MKTEELTDNDKERIEQEISRIWFRTDTADRKPIELLKEIAEYATIYEREQQANGLKSIENPDHHIKVLKEQIQRMEKEYKQLEAERSQLKTENSIYFQERNEAWRQNAQLEAERSELIKLLRDISWRFDCVAGSNMSDADKRLLKTIENSLKTK